MQTRGAFTILEMLVALVLLTIGIGASARAGRALLYLENSARLRASLAARRQARIDTLSGMRCGTAKVGTSTQGGIEERWSLSPAGRYSRLDQQQDVAVRPQLSTQHQLFIPCVP